MKYAVVYKDSEGHYIKVSEFMRKKDAELLAKKMRHNAQKTGVDGLFFVYDEDMVLRLCFGFERV